MYKLKIVRYYNNLVKIFFNKWFFLTSSYSNIYYIYFNGFTFTYINFLRIKNFFKTKAVEFERVKISTYFFDEHSWMKGLFFFKKTDQLGSEVVLVTNDLFIKNDLFFYYYLMIDYQELNMIFNHSKKYKSRLLEISLRLQFLVLNNYLFSKEYIQNFFKFLKNVENLNYFVLYGLVFMFINQFSFFFSFFSFLYKFQLYYFLKKFVA